jgi:chemotaxis protein MotB
MREKVNPFISISDLMAGVIAVVMLMLVVDFVHSAAVRQAVEIPYANGTDTESEELDTNTEHIEGIFKIDEVKIPQRDIDVQRNKILLTDGSFRSGSACISNDVERALRSTIAPLIVKKLEEYPNMTIQIEGHTDPEPVNQSNLKEISEDFKKRNCALFDDNYTLSSARAREARKTILNAVPKDKRNIINRRISVAGFGPSHLEDTENETADQNRRVEIKFISNQHEGGK